MVLNHMIQGASSDHRNERVHDQEMSHAVIELFYWLYNMWHRLVETILARSISFNFDRKNCYHVAISSTINSCCLTSLILKKVWSDDASCQNPHQTVTRCGLFFANHTWVLRTPNVAILVINKVIEVKMCFIAQNYFARKTSIHFLMINNPFHVIVSYNAPFLLTLNSQLSNCSFFRITNNLMQKWRQIQILR